MVTLDIDRAGLHERLSDRLGLGGDALFSGLFSAVLIGLVGLLSWGGGMPLLSASLGPTVYLVVDHPLHQSASLRNIVIAHAVAVGVGWLCLWLFGLSGAGSVMTLGVSPLRIAAVMSALGCASAVTLLLRAGHPPAASTTLLITLGIFQRPMEVASLYGGVLLVSLVGLALNRALGIPQPLWSASSSSQRSSL